MNRATSHPNTDTAPADAKLGHEGRNQQASHGGNCSPRYAFTESGISALSALHPTEPNVVRAANNGFGGNPAHS